MHEEGYDLGGRADEDGADDKPGRIGSRCPKERPEEAGAGRPEESQGAAPLDDLENGEIRDTPGSVGGMERQACGDRPRQEPKEQETPLRHLSVAEEDQYT